MPEHYRLPYTLRGPCAETEDMILAEVPVLPGCRAWGGTPEEALHNLDSVASEFVASYKRHGDELPEGIGAHWFCSQRRK
ncbi:MAG: type II toxin-antitoxin system HicB family antitoxin [bacterium]|nr:type II toxin-antitoxin system HicB family antitoxin [bacterium]